MSTARELTNLVIDNTPMILIFLAPFVAIYAFISIMDKIAKARKARKAKRQQMDEK